MPGTDARIRVSSVMLPASSCGTLRSARMNTRLPATSMSERRLKLMAILDAELAQSGRRGALRRPATADYFAITRTISSTLHE